MRQAPEADGKAIKAKQAILNGGAVQDLTVIMIDGQVAHLSYYVSGQKHEVSAHRVSNLKFQMPAPGGVLQVEYLERNQWALNLLQGQPATHEPWTTAPAFQPSSSFKGVLSAIKLPTAPATQAEPVEPCPPPQLGMQAKGLELDCLPDAD